MRLVCVFFLPFCVAVLGELLARIAAEYMNRKRHGVEQEYLHRALTALDLEILDMNQDGSVDQLEFLTFMLVALQKVDVDDIEEILDAFDRLDRTKRGRLPVSDMRRLSSSMR